MPFGSQYPLTEVRFAADIPTVAPETPMAQNLMPSLVSGTFTGILFHSIAQFFMNVTK